MINRFVSGGAFCLCLGFAASAAQAFSGAYVCEFTRTCDASRGECVKSGFSYQVAKSGDGWTVTDAYDGRAQNAVAEESDALLALRWTTGGVFQGEAGRSEIVLAADGAAALASIGRNDGALGASVSRGRCEREGGGDR